jgi:hypothetical protein
MPRGNCLRHYSSGPASPARAAVTSSPARRANRPGDEAHAARNVLLALVDNDSYASVEAEVKDSDLDLPAGRKRRAGGGRIVLPRLVDRGRTARGSPRSGGGSVGADGGQLSPSAQGPHGAAGGAIVIATASPRSTDTVRAFDAPRLTKWLTPEPRPLGASGGTLWRGRHHPRSDVRLAVFGNSLRVISANVIK